MYELRFMGVFTALCTLIACSGPIEPTYHGGIRALMESKCVGCHQEGGIGPFALDDPETVELLGPSIVAEVEARRMPPWGMDPECRDTVDSIRLSDDEVAAFSTWRDDGFPAGDPADYQPPGRRDVSSSSTAEDVLGPADRVLMPAGGYTPDVTRPDDYRCIVLPETIDRDLFVYAVDVLPDQRELVHHVIVYAVAAPDVPTVEARDAEDPGPGFRCFGDAGVDTADTIGGWVPGTNVGSASKEAAMRVSRGSRLVMQMHYNVAGRTAEEIAPDATGVALWTLGDGESPDWLLTSLWIPNENLSIPAGAKSSVHSATMRLPVKGYAVAVSPHMHLLGKSITTELIRDDGDVECLGRVKDWDFDWQRTYEFPESSFVPMDISDQIRITCEYDNSPENQPVINGERQEPRDVTWGDGTFDEMCLDSLVVLAPFRGRGDSGVCAGFRDCFEDCKSSDAFCPLSCMTGAGFACLSCGTEGLFGPCARSACPSQLESLDSCLAGCATTDVDVYGCLYEACRSDYEAFYACAEPGLRSGSCASDFGACEGIAP